jgi:hypothetical protein
MSTGKESDYEAANTHLIVATVAAAEAKAAADAADAHTQSKQRMYEEAVAARDAAKAAYDVAQQELRAVERAAHNASALLVSISGKAMAAEAKMDKKHLKVAEANRQVGVADCRSDVWQGLGSGSRSAVESWRGQEVR